MAYVVETKHEDMIHDAQFDYYGRRLATCSSDRTIRIFDVSGDHKTLTAELRGHEGPVWEVCWAHPKFGNVLASCSYDRRVRVWKEGNRNEWACVYEYKGESAHELSVNSISWAPHEHGLILACCSSDGCVSVMSHREANRWDVQKFQAHQIGVNAVSFGPAVVSAALLGNQPMATVPKRLVTGGSDNSVKVWHYDDAEARWVCDDKDVLEGHNDWVRDCVFAPGVGLPSSTIASCSQDGVVIIWTQDDNPASGWQKTVLPRFPGPVWRVSWSVSGNILAVSSGDNKVTLWKENPDGAWVCISTLEENAAAAAAAAGVTQ